MLLVSSFRESSSNAARTRSAAVDKRQQRKSLPLARAATTSCNMQQAATCLLTAKILRLQTRSRTYHQIIFMHHLNVSNKLMLLLLVAVAVAAAPEAFYCLARWTCLRFACADYFSHRKSLLLWGARARLGLIAAATQPTQQHSNNSSNINSSSSNIATTTTGAARLLTGCSQVKEVRSGKAPAGIEFQTKCFHPTLDDVAVAWVSWCCCCCAVLVGEQQQLERVADTICLIGAHFTLQRTALSVRNLIHFVSSSSSSSSS